MLISQSPAPARAQTKGCSHTNDPHTDDPQTKGCSH